MKAQREALHVTMAQTSKMLFGAWTSAIDGLLRDACESGEASLSTHTLVTKNIDNGGMMAWICPNDSVSGTPRFPRVVLEWSGLESMAMTVTIRRESVPASTSAPPSGEKT